MSPPPPAAAHYELPRGDQDELDFVLGLKPCRKDRHLGRKGGVGGRGVDFGWSCVGGRGRSNGRGGVCRGLSPRLAGRDGEPAGERDRGAELNAAVTFDVGILHGERVACFYPRMRRCQATGVVGSRPADPGPGLASGSRPPAYLAEGAATSAMRKPRMLPTKPGS